MRKWRDPLRRNGLRATVYCVCISPFSHCVLCMYYEVRGMIPVTPCDTIRQSLKKPQALKIKTLVVHGVSEWNLEKIVKI
nr:MAG TPA: hypothetical protein [Caudoviricetes sp.]